MFEIRPIERPVGVFTINNAKARHNHEDFPLANPDSCQQGERIDPSFSSRTTE